MARSFSYRHATSVIKRDSTFRALKAVIFNLMILMTAIQIDRASSVSCTFIPVSKLPNLQGGLLAISDFSIFLIR